MQIETKISVGDYVTILPLEMKGYVIAIYYDGKTEYKVRYFWECEPKEMYFLENEVEPAKFHKE